MISPLPLALLVGASLSIAKPQQASATTIGSAATTSRSWKRAGEGYTNPDSEGGSMLTYVPDTSVPGLGEPLNVILSATSDSRVLVESNDNGGFLNYMLSTQLGAECLGEHFGVDQAANLDGKGYVNQSAVLRWNYGNPYLGTCRETFDGGLHTRYWRQNSTGAYFLALSVELSLSTNHMVPPDGYNLGRDYLVGNLTNQTTAIEPYNVTNTTTFSGSTTWNNYTYLTQVSYVSGLLQNSSININHNDSVQQDGHPAIDGLVAVLQVSITDAPKSGAMSKFGVPVASSTVMALIAVAVTLVL